MNRSTSTSNEDHPFWKPSRTEDEVIASEGRPRKRLLAKGDDYRIDPCMETIRMELGWNEGFDIDASAVLYSEHGVFVDAVCFRKLKSNCGCVRHSGDNKTGKGNSDDEVISVTVDKLPLNVHHIFFSITLADKNAIFEQIKNASVRITNGKKRTKGEVLYKLSLTEMSESAVVMGQLTRRGAYWYFKALGTPVVGRDVRDVLKVILGSRKKSGSQGFLFSIPAANVRSILQNKVQGRESHSLDVGCVQETDTRSLEISLFDKDRFSADDFLGMVLLRGSEIFNLGLGEHTYWFSLARPKRGIYKEEIVFGEILIKIVVVEDDKTTQ